MWFFVGDDKVVQHIGPYDDYDPDAILAVATEQIGSKGDPLRIAQRAVTLIPEGASRGWPLEARSTRKGENE